MVYIIITTNKLKGQNEENKDNVENKKMNKI